MNETQSSYFSHGLSRASTPGDELRMGDVQDDGFNTKIGGEVLHMAGD